MGEFMLENMCQVRGHRTEATDGNPQFSVIHGAGPARRMRDIEEGLLRIQGHENIVAGRGSEVPDQVIVIRFESRKNLPAKHFGCLFALVVESEMLTFALREFRFNVLLALRL